MAMKRETPLLKELQDQIGRFIGQPKALRALPNVMLVTSCTPTAPRSHVAEPAFALVAQGAKRTVLGDRTYDYHAGQYLIVSVDLPIHACIARASTKDPYLGFAMILKPDAIASLLLEAGAAPSARVERSGIAVSDATDELLDPIVRLVRLLERPDDIPVLLPAIEREILWRLINGEQGAMVRQLGLADSRMTQIGRAIKWLRSHYSEAIRIGDLAGVAGMSLTSFHRHFRVVTSMSPIQYQKQIRLQEARTRLMSGLEDVANVGFQVGYDSPSQFSREYKRLFGAPPGKDGERLRSVHEVDSAVA
jgi:AraC-like DNA-binding protein